MKLKTILATAVVTAAAGFAATGASAADKADTHVSFVSATPHGGDYWYEGYIDSTKKCADNRKVKVYRIANGPDIKIGVTRANGAVGAWNVMHPAADGAYYAKAPGTDECKGDTSDELVIENG
jgi:hypothetical protein